MTVSTHVLDTERGAPAAGVRVELWQGERARRLGRDRRRRPDPRARRHRAGHLPDRLPAAVAVLPPRRARGRARRGPLPHPAARLLVRVRDLPRKLTVEELAGLVRGPHALRRAARRARRPARPRPRGRRDPDRRREEGGARRPPGDRRDGALGPQRRRAGHRRGARARRAEPRATRSASASASSSSSTGGRRARSSRSCASGSSAPASRSSRPRSTSSSRSPRTDGGAPSARADYWWSWGDLLFRWLHVIAGIAWIGSSFYFIALDNHLAPPADERRRGARRRRRGVGDPRRRLLPDREVQGRARDAPRPALLVQVGGVHDLALRLRAAHRRLLRARLDLPRRQVGRRPDDAPRRSRSRSAGSCSPGSSTTPLCRLLDRNDAALAIVVAAFVVLAAWGASQLFAPRAAYIEVGAMLGTIMVANVFFVIIPMHWKLVRAKEAGEEPDPAWNARGQAAVGAQQLPHAAGRVRDALEPLHVHLRARARLADPGRADGARRARPPLLQPPPPRPERLVDPGRRGGRASSPSRSRSGRPRAARTRPARPRASPRCRRSSRTAAPPATRCTRPSRATRAPPAGIVLETAAQIDAPRRPDPDGRRRLAGDAARQRDRA